MCNRPVAFDRGTPHSITAPDKGRSINAAGEPPCRPTSRGELWSRLLRAKGNRRGVAPAPGTTPASLPLLSPCQDRQFHLGRTRRREDSTFRLSALVAVAVVVECPLVGRSPLSQDRRRICGKRGRRASEDAASIGPYVRDGNQVASTSSRRSTLS